MKSCCGSVVYVNDILGELLDEVHIVRDENERSSIAIQREDERLHRENVEVSRGLIHEEDIGRVDEEFHEIES